MLIQVFLFILNAIIINLVFLSAFYLRYGFDIPENNFAPYKQIFGALTFCYMLAFAFARVFRPRFKAYWQIFVSVSKAMLLGTAFAVIFLYVFRIKWSSFPSSVLLISLIIGIPIITIINAIIYRLWGRLKKVVVVVGNSDKGICLEKTPRVKIKYAENLTDIIKIKDIDEILVCQHIQSSSQIELLISLLLRLKVEVHFEPQIYANMLSGSFENQNSLAYLTTFLGRKTELEEFLIRALDIVGSFILFTISLPVLLITAAAIKLTSKGPIIFKQQRIGKDGKQFTLYKFRTMINNAEKKTGPVLASNNDDRITKVGKFLRAVRLDELPQIFNVLTGSMSLVGPRPEREHFVKIHKALRGLRLAVKPGLTGLAQIRGDYDLHPSHKIRYDYIYIQRRGIIFNLYILMKTIPVVLLKKGT